MVSQARKAFDENAVDIMRLLDLHTSEGGAKPGRRFGLEVLNKSAIVLITAYWEAYCEDLAAEALSHIINNAPNSEALPQPLRKLIAKELKTDIHELAIWQLADEGWRGVLRNRFETLREQRNKKLNTPKWEHIDTLFHQCVGTEHVSDSWKWAKKMTVLRARTKLDKFVTLRGAIAHRGSDVHPVTKVQVVDYFEFIKSLAGKTGGRVNAHVTKVTGKPLWK